MGDMKIRCRLVGWSFWMVSHIKIILREIEIKKLLNIIILLF